MLKSTNRIITTHVGSLPRTPELLAANTLRLDGRYPGGEEAFAEMLEREVVALVARQSAIGIDVVGDGEYGKEMTSSVDYGAWWSYSFQRTGGLEIDTDLEWLTTKVESSPGDVRLTGFANRRDRTIFADAYNDPTSGIFTGGGKDARPFPHATGPITYIGQEAIQADIAGLKAGLAETGAPEGFITALSPGSASRISNNFYSTEEEWMYAWADVLREEYKAIIDAGLILQIDDPSIAENFDQISPEPSIKDYVAFTQLRVDALNYALRDLPEDRIRFHLCWGSWHGPHTTDIPMADIVETMLKINACGYTFEAGNVRHEHEYRVWDDVELPADKVIIPGVVSHATNVVEHPQVVADRIVRFADRVGRERVIASTDCGLGGRIHPQIAWAKLESLVEGARLATGDLW